jgi:oxygen-independent coproporphyrinogen-3 oxidase
MAGLYIHIPFCISKCPYCSFLSFPLHETENMEKYLAAVAGQADQMADHPWVVATDFTSLYIGGGTPTMYEGEELASLIKKCCQRFRIETSSPETEISVEANPNTVSFETLHCLRDAGVNRLSIGCQSFSDAMLKALGRSHTVRHSREAFEQARRAGFDNISLDLMFGLPGQRLADWQETLLKAVALAPEHFSVYELTVEENTPLARSIDDGDLSLPPEDVAVAMLEDIQQTLSGAGYERYEISNYARPGRQCRHNINYWQNNSYLGLGAGAVSYFDGFRVTNVSDPDRYISLVEEAIFPFEEGECLSREASFRETVIMGLRMTAGISCHTLEKRFGLTPDQYYGKILKRCIDQGLVVLEKDSLRLTEKGLPVANQVLAQLV